MLNAFQIGRTNPSLFRNKLFVFENQVLLGLNPKYHLFVCSWSHGEVTGTSVWSLLPSLPSCSIQFSLLQAVWPFSNTMESLQNLFTPWRSPSSLLWLPVWWAHTHPQLSASLPCPLSSDTVVERKLVLSQPIRCVTLGSKRHSALERFWDKILFWVKGVGPKCNLKYFHQREGERLGYRKAAAIWPRMQRNWSGGARGQGMPRSTRQERVLSPGIPRRNQPRHHLDFSALKFSSNFWPP